MKPVTLVALLGIALLSTGCFGDPPAASGVRAYALDSNGNIVLAYADGSGPYLDHAGPGSLWLLNNGAVHALPTPPGSASVPQIEGDLVYFLSTSIDSGSKTAYRSAVWSVELDGTNLTQQTGWVPYAMAFAPLGDGRFLVAHEDTATHYLPFQGNRPQELDLYVVDLHQDSRITHGNYAFVGNMYATGERQVIFAAYTRIDAPLRSYTIDARLRDGPKPLVIDGQEIEATTCYLAGDGTITWVDGWPVSTVRTSSSSANSSRRLDAINRETWRASHLCAAPGEAGVYFLRDFENCCDDVHTALWFKPAGEQPHRVYPSKQVA